VNDASLGCVTSLENLEELALYGSDVTDAGLAVIESLGNLRSLDIGELGAEGVAVLKELPRLEHLEISSFDPLLANAGLSELSGLQSLIIHSEPDSVATRIRLPANLRMLQLSHEAVKHLDLESCGRIERVHLDKDSLSCLLRRRDLDWLNSLPQLRALALGSVADQDIEKVARITSLRDLTLSGSPLHGMRFGDDGMKALAGLKEIESFEISGLGSSITDAGLNVLHRFPNLRQLKLLACPNVTAKGLAGVSELKRLQTLELYLCSAPGEPHSTDGVLAAIGALNELEVLSIHGAEGTLTDEGLGSLASLRNLRRLKLSVTGGCTHEGLARMMRELPNLQLLEVEYTKGARPVKKLERAD
jgi:Leucine-rich repeat (LRR) protein